MVTANRFRDDTVVVTGSTRGIGEGIAHRFASEGANVVVTGRTAQEGEAVINDIQSDGGTVSFVRADMRNPNDIESLITTAATEYGSIDVLVNNAAVQTETAVDEVTLDDWDFVMETDFRSYWLSAKYTVEYMDLGSIVNISSNHAFSTMSELFPYNAVKAGINGMTRAMALDFGPDVRVNTVNPGWVEVDRVSDELTAKERRDVESIHPVGHIGDPSDIAGVVTFLASDDAAFVTGTSLLADGGRSSVMQDNTLLEYDSD